MHLSKCAVCDLKNQEKKKKKKKWAGKEKFDMYFLACFMTAITKA